MKFGRVCAVLLDRVPHEHNRILNSLLVNPERRQLSHIRQILLKDTTGMGQKIENESIWKHFSNSERKDVRQLFCCSELNNVVYDDPPKWIIIPLSCFCTMQSSLCYVLPLGNFGKTVNTFSPKPPKIASVKTCI